MRTSILAALLVATLSLAAAPASADVVDAGAEGACYADGEGSGTSAGASLASTPTLPPHTVIYPDDSDAQEALAACAAGAADGSTPESGSHLSADASAADGTAQAQASTVPATDQATGQDDELDSEAFVRGACYADGAGDSDKAGITLTAFGNLPPHGIYYPDEGAAQDALSACAAGAAGGSTPEGGSHLSADALVADGTVAAGASTVPVTASLP